MLTELQKRTAQAIVNVFETGKARGDYGRVTVMRGGTGPTASSSMRATARSRCMSMSKAEMGRPSSGSTPSDCRAVAVLRGMSYLACSTSWSSIASTS